MRYISPNIQYLFSQSHIKTYYLIDISGTNFNSKITTYWTDLNITGLGNFSSNNQLSSFDPPLLEDASTNRETYKLSFIDPEGYFRAIAEENIVGTRIKIYMGLINTTNNTVGDALPNQPLINQEDITLGFDGIIDSREYITDSVEGTKFFNVTCTTPMGKLETTKSYITSRDYLRRVSPGDTAYDYIYDKAQEIELLWGKVG